MDQRKQQRKHAIVIGASMAGMVTARVLSDHFDQVTLIERDKVNDAADFRKGQPQARHLHGLLAEGLRILTHYFPDLPEALAAEGAVVDDMAKTMRWYVNGGYRLAFESGMCAALMSRPLLDWQIRKRVLALPNLTMLDECDVEHPTLEHGRITGVEIRRRSEGNRQQMLTADLVVDASGRASAAPKWLAALGYEKPEESVVKVDVGYATRTYRRDPADPVGRHWFLLTPDAPRERRFAGMFPIEGDRWIISVGGWHGDHGPLDEEAFLTFVRDLPMPEFYTIISRCEPLTEVTTYKYPASLRRHYEKLSRFPAGFLVLGDAICSFNPTYGQGMTSAIIQAQVLDELLHQNMTEVELAQRFFKAAAKVIDIPWQLAVGEDFRFAETEGRKAPGTELINKYVNRVNRASHTDPVVCRAFLLVMNLMAPPTSLFHPKILWRVLRNHRSVQSAPTFTPVSTATR